MSVDYTQTAADVDEQLRDAGQPVTVRTITPGDEYDPETGGPGAPGEVDLQGFGAVFDYKLSDMDGSLIKQGDQRLLLSPLQADGTAMPMPSTSDKIVIGGSMYSIQPSGKVAPAGVSVLYKLQIRGV